MTTGTMQGKICLITGANSGIGYEAALALAKMGAQIVMVCRSRAKGEAAQATIKAESGNQAVDLLIADLSVQQSIRDLAAAFNAKYNRLDVLVNNAGVIIGKREVSADGYEMTFAVNHLAYFLLTELLLDTLKASAPARIVNVASEAENVGGVIDFDDLMLEKKFSMMRAYGQSKRANIVFTYELAKRLAGTGVTANCLHPGGVRTNWGKQTGTPLSFVLRLGGAFLLSPAQGAETIIYLASSPEVEGVTGQYYTKKKPLKSNAQTYDPAVQARLWQISEQLTKLAT
jgi:NAD(P)-dependent dehydrogenase (short-subunit alcohol dehydrogenase family)